MDWDIAITIVAGVLLVVAAVGVVYPVLPGSLIAIVTLIVWAVVVGSWAAWVAAIVGALLCAVGWSASAVLTGRRLKQLEVPGWSIAVAFVAGVAGMFLIPVVGLFVGFAVGLLVSEAVRHRDVRRAVHYSVETLKAMGTGVLVELGMLCVASAVWSAGALVHFTTT
jgi:uncharacterized protein YqgC (DUF456 family)